MTDIPEDALARLQKRVDDWKHNSDTATVSVKLGDLRAAVSSLADRAAQAERMARLEEALRDLLEVVGLPHDSAEYAQRLIPSWLLARRALSQEGSDA